ncbi:MAG TPA: SRPBCC family protein [Polyangia bacterium]
MSTLDVTADAQVSAPLDVVWRYVAEGYFEHHGLWDPAIRRMRKLTDGPLRAGTRGVETRRSLGDQDAEFEITGYEIGKRVALRNTTGPFVLERAYSFVETATTTTVRFDFHMAPKGVMRLIFPLLRRTIERQVRANVARISCLVASTQ